MDNSIQREAITLPEPISQKGSFSSPGYYVIDQTGNPVSDRYDSQAAAYANLHGGAGVQYLDQPLGGHLNQPWPPELHTVVGHTGQGEQMYTEADLLRVMASTTDLDEQRQLMGALEELRRDARAVMAGANQVDFAPPNRVGEEKQFYPYHSGAFGSSSATDWLGEMGASNDGMPEHMLTMGSRFFIGCHPEVKADPIEYMTQALGVARVAASQFGDIEGAVTIFMEHAANLNRVDMTKIGQEILEPWSAEPEELPPTDSNYPGPYSTNMNTDVVDEPPLGEAEPLDNGASARAVQGSAAVLSSHQHMSEFLFDPPTPEELAQASGPGNLNQQFGAPASSEDDSAGPEPAVKDQTGVEPVTASRKQAADDDGDGGDYQYIHHRPGHKDSEGQDAPWVVTQKGTGKVLSSHPSREVAIDSFKAMMQSKHGGSLHCACLEFRGDFVMRDGQKVAGYIDHRQCPVHEAVGRQETVTRNPDGGHSVRLHATDIVTHHGDGTFTLNHGGWHTPTTAAYMNKHVPEGYKVFRRGGKLHVDGPEGAQPIPDEGLRLGGQAHAASRAFNPDPTSYEEYLSRLAPGSTGVSREFFSGAMAAHSPSENDVSVPAWGRRERPKASVTQRPTDFRGVTDRRAARKSRVLEYRPVGDMDEEAIRGHLADHHGIGSLSDWKNFGEGISDPHGEHELDHSESGETLGHYHPDIPHSGRKWVQSSKTGANEDMLNPQAFERADESDAPSIRGNEGGSYNPKDTWEQSGEAAHDITGLIPQSDLAENFSNISDFPDTGDAAVPSDRADLPSLASKRTAIKWSPASGMAGRGIGAGSPYGEFMPTHTYNPIGWDALDARPHPGSTPIAPGTPVQLHGKMDPSGHLVHVRDEDGNHQTIDKRSLGTLHREGSRRRAAWSGYEPGPYEPSPEEEGGLREHLLGAHGFGEGVLGPDIERMHKLHDMDHAEIEEGQGIPGGAYSHSHEAAFRVTAADDDDDDDDEGKKTGGPEDKAGAYEPDRSLYSESPEGQAEATRGYEEAYSSDRMIDFTGAGVDVLGTVPVQGYAQDASRPNGEMWPWEQNPIGSPPVGAAAVADVPTPGMVSAEQTGNSWPQPNVAKNARLDAFRANIAARTGS
jgi:hypothetical protein